MNIILIIIYTVIIVSIMLRIVHLIMGHKVLSTRISTTVTVENGANQSLVKIFTIDQ